MDISPLADKQQRNNNRNSGRRARSDDGSRLDEYSPPTASTPAGQVLSLKRIQNLIQELNQMAGSIDITFELKQAERTPNRNTIVEVVDSKRNELLLELTMVDLVEIEKQMKEDLVEDLTELMCGSFFSLTA
jgi:hypothetical protein